MSSENSWLALRRKVISNKTEIRLVVPFQLVAGLGLICGFIVLGLLERIVPKNEAQKKQVA